MRIPGEEEAAAKEEDEEKAEDDEEEEEEEGTSADDAATFPLESADSLPTFATALERVARGSSGAAVETEAFSASTLSALQVSPLESSLLKSDDTAISFRPPSSFTESLASPSRTWDDTTSGEGSAGLHPSVKGEGRRISSS